MGEVHVARTDGLHDIELHGRPGLAHFLREAAVHFDLAVWSMGTAEYVRLVVRRLLLPVLGPDPPIALVYDRRDCVASHFAFGFHKDLRLAELRTRIPVALLFLLEDQPDNAPPCQRESRVVTVAPFKAGNASDDGLKTALVTLRAMLGTARKRQGSPPALPPPPKR